MLSCGISEFLRLCMQFPHMQATQSCVPMTVNPTPMPVLIPCHRHLTFGRQLCSNMGKSERDIYWERISSSPATQPVHADLSRGQHKLRFHRNAQTAGPGEPNTRGKEKEMPRIAIMTMRHLRSNFLTKVSAMNEMRMPYSFEPTCRLVGGDLEVPICEQGAIWQRARLT